MGEHILLDGQVVKIGTCENLYYCRYGDLAEWIAAGRVGYVPGNAQPAQYLAGAYRFRFPFPNEDGAEYERHAAYAADYDRGVLIPYPPELVQEAEHHTVTAEIRGYRPFRQYSRFAAPCPLSANKPAWFAPSIEPTWFESAIEPASAGAPWVELVQQRPLDGVLWPVFRCPWCYARWRVEREEAERIAAHALDTAPKLRLDELMRRMLAGYDGLPAGGV